MQPKHIKTATVALLIFIFVGCATSEQNEQATNEVFVNALLFQMTVDEKIGQMTQVDRQFLTDITDISKYNLGSLLSGGGSTPEVNKPELWADMYDSYQKEALKTRLGIPLVYGIDAVHGHNNVIGATIFPHNIGLGATGDAKLVEAVSEATALEVAATGIDWTFAPCITVPRDIRWGRTYEGFSEDPALVTKLGEAAILGYQSYNLNNPNSILACAKHFIGDGGTVFGTGLDGMVDRGDVQLTEKELREIHLTAYKTAIETGVATIMASYNSFNGNKIHGNKYLLTDLLKTELGFQGFVISDWAAIDDIPGDYKSDIIISINAGIDMVMVSGGNEPFPKFVKLFKEAVEEGSIPMSRIDDAVRRILLVKKRYGLFERPFTDRTLLPHVGSDKHRAIATEAVEKSMVILKNQNAILPLKKEGQRIVVAGKGADNIGMQCGGWTISWQGGHGAITTGTTILEAIRSTVEDANNVLYTENGENASGDVAIVVVGEDPYAEMKGDRSNLELGEKDLTLINNIQSKGIPVVVLLLSGRPMLITDHLEQWDAFVAAWLPGTEGKGVSNVLFGDYKPTGRLPFSWPRSMNQLPVSKTDDHLFNLGYGLTY